MPTPDHEVVVVTRHRVKAAAARQDRDETVLVDADGQVVARWPTRDVERILWPDVETKPTAGTKDWLEAERERHPRAYQPWTAQEDAELTEQHLSGRTVAELADLHDRRPSAITSRLAKLGLVVTDPPHVEGPPADDRSQT